MHSDQVRTYTLLLLLFETQILGLSVLSLTHISSTPSYHIHNVCSVDSAVVEYVADPIFTNRLIYILFII